MPEQELYQCPECGLHYADKAIAAECEEFCRANNACSLAIAQNSIEAKQKGQSE